MQRRVFTKEFKLAAVKLVVEDEMDVKEVAKQLGVHYNSLYRWVQEFEEYGESAFPGRGCKIYDYQAEIYRLQRRNRDLEDQLALLKKYQVFLRKEKK
jgi:transposase